MISLKNSSQRIKAGDTIDSATSLIRTNYPIYDIPRGVPNSRVLHVAASKCRTSYRCHAEPCNRRRCRKLSLMRIVLSCMPDSISTPGVSNFSRSRLFLVLSRARLTLSSLSVSLRTIDAETIEQNFLYLVCLSSISPFLYPLDMIVTFS